MLREDLQKVLNEYLIAKKENGTTSAPIAHYIVNDMRDHFNEILNPEIYLCTSFAGLNNLDDIPRMDFEIKNIENKPKVDVAYLFKADMAGVYLVLKSFYYEDLKNKYQKELPNYLKSKSIHIRELLEKNEFKIEDLNENEIDLASDSTTTKLYNSGIIFSKYYESDNLPSEEELISDLKRFLEIEEYLLNNYVDEMYLTVDEWKKSLENEELVTSKLLNVLEIIYHFKDHTACYKDISKYRQKLGFQNESDYSFVIGKNSKKLKEHFNKTALYDKKGEEEHWSRLFYGKEMENPEMTSGKAFYFTLREELVKALGEYDKTKRPDRVMMPLSYIEPENKDDNNETQYWLISAGESAGWWDEFCKNNEVGIGFTGTGDLNQYETEDEIKVKLQEISNGDSSPKHDAHSCWQFVHDIKIGDVIFVKKGTKKIIGRGIIESTYKYDENKPYHKLRKVNWTHNGNWDIEETLPQKTLTDITNDSKLENIQKLFENKYNSFHDFLTNNGYYFDKKTIENYLLSLKVKPFVILTGNSGTGKTKLSQLFAQYLNQKDNYKIIPVGANWTENRHILGYHDIINDKDQYTPAYYLIEKAQKESYPHFLILDEMNLSHVERYFADFLSAIESDENIPLHGKEELEIPNNLFIIGTVNVDETTYMFSPKVLDRANTIEFKTYPAKDYMTDKLNMEAPEGNIEYLEDLLKDQEIREMPIQELKKVFSNDDFWKELSDEISEFQKILKKAGFDFGFRVINEITRFMAVAYRYEDEPENWANWKPYFDAQIKQKMLPKLHGSQKVIGETLDELLEACKEYPTSKEKLEEMIDVLNKQRYVSFIN